MHPPVPLYDGYKTTSLPQVHRLLSELYGHLVETKSYVARPSKRAKLGDGRGSPSGEQLPQISVRFRHQAKRHLSKRQDVGGDSPDLCTQFVLRKKNLVSNKTYAIILTIFSISKDRSTRAWRQGKKLNLSFISNVFPRKRLMQSKSSHLR